MEFSKKELERYGRHLLLSEIGQQGQLKLKKSKILLIGTGGLGSPAAIYLAAAGVGTIGLIDFDRVDLSNLHRQVIHFTPDIGRPKVISAQEKINALNPEIKVVTYDTKLDSSNALEIFKEFDLIVDGTDNFPSRYLINDACVLSKKPYVFGGILRFEGQCSIFGLDDGPCYRCLFSEPPQPGQIPSCSEAGVLGVLPGVIGLLQANEAIKLICGIGQPLKGRLLLFDALAASFREVRIKKNPQCAICGPNRTITKLIDYQLFCDARPKTQETANTVQEISVKELKNIMDQKSKGFYLLDVREQFEWELAKIDGAVLKPLSSLKDKYQDIPKDKRVFVHCKLGGRSRQAAEFLKTKGYQNVFNVKGGIDAWAQEVDPKITRY